MENNSISRRKNTWKQNLSDLTRIYILVFLLLLGATEIFSQLPTGFVTKKLTANNIVECVKIEHAPDGRIFLAERGGKLKLLKNGVVSTIHTVSTTTASEQGLLGITLHSDFAQNGKLYLYYTDPAITKHYLDVIVLDTASQVLSSNRLMEFDPVVNGFHNGGAMLFKNGYLYLCIGESNAPQYAQQLNTYRGKVLRLLDDGNPAPGNPYYTTGVTRQQKSIWAIGMRNPWAMSMDPVTQKLFVCNVGGNYEEIDDVTNPSASKNYDYGWGTSGKSGVDQAAGTILPVFAYNGSTWSAATCAITSGTFFNPPATNYPNEYKNKFYFTDWCTGWLRSVNSDNPGGGWQEFFPGGFNRILATSVGIDGNIYYSEYANSGNIWRIEYTLSNTPIVVNQPMNQTVYAHDGVSFSVTASGTGPLMYQWQKDSVNIPGAKSSTYTIDSTATGDSGNYRVIVSNTYGTIASTGATLNVLPYNAFPVAHIVSPLSNVTANVLDVISYSGTGTDAEDGALPASAFEWEVRLFHKDCLTCGHWHPGPAAADGVMSGSFVADNGGESSSNVWFRLILRVTDSNGRVGVDSLDLQPNKVELTVNSNVPGLQVIIGSSSITPYAKTLVVNNAINITAMSPQTVGDSIYSFSSWNHGGVASQSIRVPAVNTTYTANFTAAYISNINLALNKKAGSSSNQTAGNTASKAVDGSAGTRWESKFADPQWIAVNLGAVYNIARVKITWENAMAKNYVIQTSMDSITWTPIKSVFNNSTAINDNTGLAGTGQYIRIYGTERTTQYGYSIFELEVYGALADMDVVTGVNIISIGEDVEVFPNPFSTELTLKAKFHTNSFVNITLVDFQGYVVLDRDFPNPTGDFFNTINVEQLPAGTYVMKLFSGEEVFTEKLIKQ